jgi:hypothetical protein
LEEFDLANSIIDTILKNISKLRALWLIDLFLGLSLAISVALAPIISFTLLVF